MNGGISVIIPAYNRARLIGETLRSLLNQTVPAREMVVVDDGSTDGTAEAAQEAFHQWESGKVGKWEGGTLPELRVIRQENAGPGAARNRGLAASTGEFIHFFDSDDIAAPNKHEVQLRALQESGAHIAYGPWIKGRMDQGTNGPRDEARRVRGGELSATSEVAATRHPLLVTPYARFEPVGPVLQARGLPKGNLVKSLLTDWSIVPHACLFRRSIVEHAGGFPDDIWVGEDQLMFLRCLLAGAKVVHTPETLTYYRVGGDGKLTSVGEAQRRHARDWGRFLVRAHEEVRSKESRVKGNGQRSEDGGRRSDVGGGTEDEPATRDSRRVTTTPSAWFGFRLRAYEAWKDLEKFFPGSEEELKAKLSTVGRFESGKVERWKCKLAGWWVRKVAGIRGLLTGSRARKSFRTGKYGPKEEALFAATQEHPARP